VHGPASRQPSLMHTGKRFVRITCSTSPRFHSASRSFTEEPVKKE
jgi:hypothetical protein